MTATGRIAVEDGRLVFRSTALRLGSLPAPAALRELLSRQIDSGMQKLNRSIEGRLEEVRVTGQELVVRLSRAASGAMRGAASGEPGGDAPGASR